MHIPEHFVETRFMPGVLEPSIASFLERESAKGLQPPWAVPLPDVRERVSRALIEEWAAHDPVAIGAVENTVAVWEHRRVPLRLYVPEGTGPFAVTVFIHGGGWVICSLDTHDRLCRLLCAGARSVVVAVDYRLAPEHRFPTALDDVCAALQWTRHNAHRFDADPGRMAVVGDSAGGNLAAGLALRMRDSGGPRLRLQLLLYPVTDVSSFDRSSYRRYAEGFGLCAEEMAWYRDHYVPDTAQWASPSVSPLRCDKLEGLPPAEIVTAEFDVLRDEAEQFAWRLRQAGVDVRCTRFSGVIHGFLSMDGFSERAREGLALVTERLRRALD